MANAVEAGGSNGYERGAGAGAGAGGGGGRPPRLPRWTRQEILVLIEGKRVVAGEEAVFDSGRAAAEDGLFSDFEEEKEVEEDEEPAEEEERPAAPPPPPPPAPVVAVVPISEKYEPSRAEGSDQGVTKDKQPADNIENGSPSREGQKRRRTSQDGAGDINLQSQLIEVLERNSRMLTAQLEAQNVNCQLDRDQRKDQTNSLLSVLGKLADALGRIADKL